MEFGLIDIFTILLVTIGPLKAAIIFGMLTSNADTAFRKKVATKAVTVAFIVSMVFAIFGEFILQIFHVSGRIAGILLAALAVQLMIIALRDLGVLAPLESVGH